MSNRSSSSTSSWASSDPRACVSSGLAALARLAEAPSAVFDGRDHLVRDGVMAEIPHVRDALTGLDAAVRQQAMDLIAARRARDTATIGLEQCAASDGPAAEAARGALDTLRRLEPPARARTRVAEDTVVDFDGLGGERVEVVRMNDGTYDVRNAGVVRHSRCSAEDAMRALAHYAHSCAYAHNRLAAPGSTTKETGRL